MKKYIKNFHNNIPLQLVYLIILSMGLISCTTYYIPIKSFKQQFKGIDSTSLKVIEAVGPVGEKFSYPSNLIDTIYCVDDNDKPFKLPNSPSIEIRFTDNNDDHTIFYFDTIFLQDSLVNGAKSRFIPSVRDVISINNVKLIEVQDGKKNFSYSKDK